MKNLELLSLLKRLRYAGSITFVSALLLDRSLGHLVKIIVDEEMKLSPEIDFGQVVLSLIFICSFFFAIGCVLRYYKQLKDRLVAEN
jgi:hypothetical protein